MQLWNISTNILNSTGTLTLRLLVFRSSNFSECTSWTTSVMYDLSISPSVNGFPAVANKCTTQKLGHVAASLFVFACATVFCCNNRQHFIASRSAAQSFPTLPHTFTLSEDIFSQYYHGLSTKKTQHFSTWWIKNNSNSSVILTLRIQYSLCYCSHHIIFHS